MEDQTLQDQDNNLDLVTQASQADQADQADLATLANLATQADQATPAILAIQEDHPIHQEEAATTLDSHG